MNPERGRRENTAAVNEEGDYVLYWMTSARRTHNNFALESALKWCDKLRKPLLVLEGVNAGVPWASLRTHKFIVQGMKDNAACFSDTGITYYPYVEPKAGAASGLVKELSRNACVIVGDRYPTYVQRDFTASVAGSVACRMDTVDTNGLLPMDAADKTFPTAYSFRRFPPEVPRPAP